MTGKQIAETYADHKIASIYPLLNEEQLSELAADIETNGLLEPIVIYENKILDGRNRYRACLKVNVDISTVQFKGTNPTSYVISMNDKRRHLTPSQRAAAAVMAEPIFTAEAKKRQQLSQGRGKKGREILPHLKGKATEQAGKALGVSGRYVSQAKKLYNEQPEIFEQVHRGNKTLQQAKKESDQIKRQEKRIEATKKIKTWDNRIILGDFREKSNTIIDGSLSLIFTDPPYHRSTAPVLKDLAIFANNKLAEGGSLIVYVAHINLHAAMNIFDEYLRYWWTIGCFHSGRRALMREYGIRVGWKPVLWYVQGTRDDKSNIVEDVMSGGEEKSDHEWQQAEPEAAYWIEKLCHKDDIVCDPFLGGGTTAIAAQRLNRRWIGFEIDKNTASIANERLLR
ncbi:MAG: ParB/RepB/Spo0J family partition protein [Planctomycetota bacterium]|jgi:hypothetical protein